MFPLLWAKEILYTQAARGKMIKLRKLLHLEILWSILTAKKIANSKI